jgi:hypothetical protein
MMMTVIVVGKEGAGPQESFRGRKRERERTVAIVDF